MALPLTRDVTAQDGGTLDAAVVNALQDAVITGAHGTWQRKELAGHTYDPGQAPFTFVGTKVTVTGVGAPSWKIQIPIHIPAGSIVNSVTIYGDAPSANMNFETRIERSGLDGTQNDVVSAHNSPIFSGSTDFSYLIDSSIVVATNLLPFTTLDDEVLTVRIEDGPTNPAETYDFHSIVVDYYKP